jgi:hypothetical protein
MAGPEEMDEPAPGDGPGAQRGDTLDALYLGRLEVLQKPARRFDPAPGASHAVFADDGMGASCQCI